MHDEEHMLDFLDMFCTTLRTCLDGPVKLCTGWKNDEKIWCSYVNLSAHREIYWV